MGPVGYTYTENEVVYKLSPELRKRIRLYCALFGKTDNWDDRVLKIEEVKYLCEPHPSFLDYIITENESKCV